MYIYSIIHLKYELDVNKMTAEDKEAVKKNMYLRKKELLELLDNHNMTYHMIGNNDFLFDGINIYLGDLKTGVDLYEEKVDNNLELFVNGKYIGKDEVVTNPEITLNINCLYVYTDADESYTDVLEDKLVLKQSGSSLKGELTFNLKQEVLDGYSCSYNVDSTTGNYIVK